ncbi:MAG TPA: BTAD domain-containing putative transcriptional regulator [Gaiellaceae bacterium]|nr:BTAD domain-containing putative transcriptional regulator [Gaiellaceae bacterium]
MQYRILGPLEVVDEGGEPVALRRLKERLVLAILLLHANEFVSHDRLVDELWGEAPPPTARKAVYVYVSQLRKALARNGHDPIATVDGGYRLDVDSGRLDVSRMQQLLASARECAAAGELDAAAERLRETLGLWRGPTLAGLLLESHSRDEIAQLDELRLTTLMERIDCDLALGRHEDVLGELRVLVAEHPLQERLRGQLMLALYRAGRQADALDAYQEARDALVEELGIEPSPALQRLQKGILMQDPALELPAGIATRSDLARPAPDAPVASTRLVLAEDHYLLREGMRRLLETNPELEVAAVCEDLDSLLAAVEAERPDVVVTDIRMPPGNIDEGIRASDRLRREHPDVGVVVLSQYLEPTYALALFEEGTERRAYLLKERVHDLGQLVAAIRAVAEGGSVVDPKVVEALVAEKTRREHSPLNELTQRERDVLREMAEGKSNAAIAEALRLSERTVEKVVHAIFLKLGLALETAVHKRVKAVIFYLSGTDAETRPAETSS